MNLPLLIKTKEEINLDNIRGLKIVNLNYLKNYKLVNTYFVDSSGMGIEEESALTINQFLNKIRIGFYYGIIDSGQFQVYIGEFEKLNTNNEIEYLNPVYDNAKSFYKKAIIIREDNKVKLLSYETIVLILENNKPIITGDYSKTTLRHIKEFLKQNGFKAESKKQIYKDYLEGQK